MVDQTGTVGVQKSPNQPTVVVVDGDLEVLRGALLGNDSVGVGTDDNEESLVPLHDIVVFCAEMETVAPGSLSSQRDVLWSHNSGLNEREIVLTSCVFLTV